jgi:hypothetical protein
MAGLTDNYRVNGVIKSLAAPELQNEEATVEAWAAIIPEKNDGCRMREYKLLRGYSGMLGFLFFHQKPRNNRKKTKNTCIRRVEKT